MLSLNMGGLYSRRTKATVNVTGETGRTKLITYYAVGDYYARSRFSGRTDARHLIRLDTNIVEC